MNYVLRIMATIADNPDHHPLVAYACYHVAYIFELQTGWGEV